MKDIKIQTNIAVRPRIDLTEEERNRLIKQNKKDSTSAGRTQYSRFLLGEKLTYKEAVLAKCYECDGGHSDGRYDCEVPSCPLYLLMPYKGTISPLSCPSSNENNIKKAHQDALNDNEEI